jgi:hypothetical protein
LAVPFLAAQALSNKSSEPVLLPDDPRDMLFQIALAAAPTTAPIIAGIAAIPVQWLLEHIGIQSDHNGQNRRFVFVPDNDEDKVKLQNIVTLSPPLLSTTVRIADQAVDLGEAAGSIISAIMKTFGSFVGG